MKLLFFLAAALLAPAGDLGGIRNVYLLPMSNGLDQFLAIKLTTGDILQVVTDPLKADAIMTDHVGGSLEQKLDELYGERQKEEKPKDEKPKDDKADLFDSQRPVSQPLSRARGAIFLIDRKSRNVVWSDYERPRNTTPDGINQLAEKFASKLAKDVKGK